ncbi:MAG: hypothetical protein OXF65_05910 [Acidimicrobiaceae bacterium]|nr:hypothetical protein [Acidimicrobiaceae bacterium]
MAHLRRSREALGVLREVGDDFQADSSRQGAAFEQQAKAYLGALGFELHGRRKFADIGCEIDDVAEAPNGELVYFEYKGSFKGSRPGMQRTDTVKKALLTGFLLRSIGDDTPYYVLTSHLPTGGAAQRMIEAALSAKAVSGVLEMNDPMASQALKERFGWPARPRMGPERTWQPSLPIARRA